MRTLLSATASALRARSTSTYDSATASFRACSAPCTWALAPRPRASAAAMLDDIRPPVNSGTLRVAEPIAKSSPPNSGGAVTGRPVKEKSKAGDSSSQV